MSAAKKYMHIAQTLEGEICAGRWAVGERLPIEPELRPV